MLPIRALVLTLLIGSLNLATSVASPAISKLSVRGVQAGGTTPLVIEGSELGPNTALLTAVPGVTAQVKPTSTPQRVEADVTVDAQTPSGIYLFRVASATGISNAVPISIDALPQAPFVPHVSSLPIALSGELTGSTVHSTSFAGKKGQRIVVDVESRRLGGRLKPVVRLLDARRTQLAWGKPMPAISGDTRCEVLLPADGTYTVELSDLVYRGDGPGEFRLKIGDLQYADLTFPLGVERGKPATLEFVSTSFPRGSQAIATFPTTGDAPAAWPTGLQFITGGRPRLIVSPYPELSEQRSENKPQEISTAPVAVSGKLTTRGEHDLYRLPVTPGQALRFDVFAHRLGSPIDVTLTVMNEQQGVLVSNDDLPATKDAGLDFTVPQGVNAVLVGVRDVLNLADPLGVYRLQVTPLGTPDFTLSMSSDAIQLPADGNTLLRVHVDRRDYNGPIKLSLPGLASGLVVSRAEIAAGASDALVSITAPASGAASSLVSIVGESVDIQPPIVRTALTPDAIQYKPQPWLRTEFGIGITPRAQLKVVWDLPKGDTNLMAGDRVPFHAKIERIDGATGAVRLAVVTSLPMLRKHILENNQPKPIDDIERSVHLDGTPTIAADQSEINGTLILPFEQPAATFDAIVRADLLAADGKSVVSSIFAAARPIQSVKPPAEQPRLIFEDQAEFVAALTDGSGQAALHEAEKYSGKASVRVTPPHKYNPKLPGMEVKIREKPAPGEYRYLQFAWKKPNGNVGVQIAHDGIFGPKDNKPPSYRYQSGAGAEFNGMALRIDAQQPQNFVLVTRDLFADFGEFTMTGFALSAIDGDAALFDHIYLGRTPSDFDLVKP